MTLPHPSDGILPTPPLSLMDLGNGDWAAGGRRKRSLRDEIRSGKPRAMKRFVSLAFLTVLMLHGESGVACGGGVDGTVVESGYAAVVSVDRAGATVTLDHGATPYILKEGRTRFPVAGPNVLEEAVAAARNRVRFEIWVSKGDTAIAHIESAP